MLQKMKKRLWHISHTVWLARPGRGGDGDVGEAELLVGQHCWVQASKIWSRARWQPDGRQTTRSPSGGHDRDGDDDEGDLRGGPFRGWGGGDSSRSVLAAHAVVDLGDDEVSHDAMMKSWWGGMAGVSCLIVVLNDKVDVSVNLMPQRPMAVTSREGTFISKIICTSDACQLEIHRA